MRFESRLLILSISLLAGCGQTVVIPPGTVVRLARPASGLHIAVYDHRDANGIPVYRDLDGTADFPAGTYLVPPTSQPAQ